MAPIGYVRLTEVLRRVQNVLFQLLGLNSKGFQTSQLNNLICIYQLHVYTFIYLHTDVD